MIVNINKTGSFVQYTLSKTPLYPGVLGKHNAPGKESDPCLHSLCTECHGTGVNHQGGMCFHNLSCSCPRCTPR